jgi:hypothetical protein
MNACKSLIRKLCFCFLKKRRLTIEELTLWKVSKSRDGWMQGQTSSAGAVPDSKHFQSVCFFQLCSKIFNSPQTQTRPAFPISIHSRETLLITRAGYSSSTSLLSTSIQLVSWTIVKPSLDLVEDENPMQRREPIFEPVFEPRFRGEAFRPI